VIVGLTIDDEGEPRRIVRGPDCLLVGGSEHQRAELLETALRLETELERLGRDLGEIPPDELAEIAWRIDSPDLHRIAVRLQAGLDRLGLSFDQAAPEQLTAILLEGVSDAGEPRPGDPPDGRSTDATASPDLDASLNANEADDAPPPEAPGPELSIADERLRRIVDV